MGHPVTINQTSFAATSVFATDEDMRALVVPLVRGVFDVRDDGTLVVAEQQREIALGGEHNPGGGVTSYRFEPEVAFFKPSFDVALVGHARPLHGRETELRVEFSLGGRVWVAKVTGDRVWEKGLLGGRPSPPAPFEAMPLVWERAFGGWDRSADDPAEHRCEPRNPLGIGFRRRSARFVEGSALPNIEDPHDNLTSYRGRCRPTGLGFTGADWPHRAQWAGTYDEAWEKDRRPLLPRDFDRRFFNAAADGWALPETPPPGTRGRVVGAGAPLGFVLPAFPPLRAEVEQRSAGHSAVDLCLDTLVVDVDSRQVLLTWRGFTEVPGGAHDVAVVRIAAADPHARGVTGKLQRDPAAG